jgi:putative lipoic acid-binding regulatory protein
MDSDRINAFKEQLDKAHAWPVLYMFKFIVPAGTEEEVKKLFPRHIPTEKHSQNGKYISVTIQMMMPSSDAVIEVYQVAAQIEGLIAL